MLFLKKSREEQVNYTLSLLPQKLQALFASGDEASVSVFSSFQQYIVRGEFDYLEMFVDPQKVSIDVGTNNGQYALKLSTISKACLCLEPTKAYQFLTRILPDNCVFKRLAAGNHTGVAKLRIPKIDNKLDFGQSTLSPDNTLNGCLFEEEEIEVSTIDKLVLEVFPNEKVGFIKIDVEGFEDIVLEGAVNTLKKFQPNLQIELHGNKKISMVCDFLSKLDYKGLFFFDGRLHDYSLFNPDIHRAEENEYYHRTRHGLPFEPSKYICDFYFIPNASAHSNQEQL